MDQPASTNRGGAAPGGAEVEVLASEAHPLDLGWLRERLLAALRHVPRPVSNLVVAVVDDERMIALNQRHRGEAQATDVLAFEHSAPREALEADIVICADVAARRAAQHGHRAEQELLLYALHGVLHCAGFDDHDEARSAAMHAEEDRILSAIGVGPTFARGEGAARRRTRGRAVGNLYIWLATAALAAGTYLSAMKLALVQSSRAAIGSVLEEAGRERAAAWLARRYDSAVFAMSLLRMITRVGFFMLVLAQVTDLHARTATSLTWTDLTVSGLISVTLLWVFTSVLGGAVARHSGLRLVVSSLWGLRVMTGACHPLTWAVSFIDEAVRRLAGAAPKRDEPQELLRSIEETHREGGLDEESASMLENVVEFTNTDVAEIMTPRMDIQGIEVTDDLSKIRAFIARCGHSRIPVYRENLDHILGVLYVKDLVRYLGQDTEGFKLEPILRQPIFVPETKPVRELLSDFRRSEVHMAIVVDEYGGTEGLVTIEDVLEEIVGEIRDEHEGGDEGLPALHAVDDYRAEVDGRFRVGDLNQRLGLSLPEDQDFDTIGGFVLATLGHVPTVGETFESHNARFTALSTAPTHVRKVGIELLPAATNGRADGA